MQHQSIRHSVSVTAVLLVALVASGGNTAEFTMPRHTVDGGGEMFSAGGDFELSGTIGQADAGAMSGDVFTLTGGFWFALAPGDCDEDGGINLFDYAAFSACTTGPNASQLPTECLCSDFDGDKDVDLPDFGAFQIGFSGS